MHKYWQIWYRYSDIYIYTYYYRYVSFFQDHQIWVPLVIQPMHCNKIMVPWGSSRVDLAARISIIERGGHPLKDPPRDQKIGVSENWMYPLDLLQFANWKMATEMVSFGTNSMVIVHS